MKNIYKELKKYIKNHIKHLGKYEEDDEFLDIEICEIEELIGEDIPTEKMDKLLESCMTYISTLKEVKGCRKLRNFCWKRDGTPGELFVIGIGVRLNIKK